MSYAVKQKLKYPVIALSFLVAVMGIQSALFGQHAAAATLQPAGTCFLFVQSQPEKIGLCTKIAPGVKDNKGKPDTSAGTPLDPTKCYEISEGLATSSIVAVNCDDTTAGVAMCPNNEPAPNNDTNNCTVNLDTVTGAYHCGGGSNAVKTSINIGCKGTGNAIIDAMFAIIRFLSTGVGLVLVASMIWAGIQYTSSRGDPQATSQAIGRIRANIIALLLFIFAYALINYVIPGAVLQK